MQAPGTDGSGGSGRLSGGMSFDDQKVRAFASKFCDQYHEITEQLITNMQGQFIDSIAGVDSQSLWASPDAVKFFTNVAEVVGQMRNAITNVYSSLHSATNKAYQNWLTQTKTVDYVVLSELPINTADLNVGGIKENVGGEIIVDTDMLLTFIPVLNKIQEAISTALQGTVDAIPNSGFDDANQKQIDALLETFTSLKTEIDKSLTDMTTVFNQTITTTVETTEGVIKANEIDLASIATNPEDTLSGNFVARENILDQYWTEDDGSTFSVEIRNDGTAVIWKTTPEGEKIGMGMTTAENGRKLLGLDGDKEVAGFGFNAEGVKTPNSGSAPSNDNPPSNENPSSTGKGDAIPSEPTKRATTAYEQDSAFLEENKDVLKVMKPNDPKYNSLYEEEAARIKENEGTLKRVKAQPTSGIAQRMAASQGAAEFEKNFQTTGIYASDAIPTVAVKSPTGSGTTYKAVKAETYRDYKMKEANETNPSAAFPNNPFANIDSVQKELNNPGKQWSEIIDVKDMTATGQAPSKDNPFSNLGAVVRSYKTYGSGKDMVVTYEDKVYNAGDAFVQSAVNANDYLKDITKNPAVGVAAYGAYKAVNPFPTPILDGVAAGQVATGAAKGAAEAVDITSQVAQNIAKNVAGQNDTTHSGGGRSF